MTWEEWIEEGRTQQEAMEQQRRALPPEHPERLRLEKRLSLMTLLLELARLDP
jgi:hypothetical protein